MNTSFNFEEIKYKNELVDTAIIQLKKDFVGIDEQIDEVMNNVRTWYLYPQLQTRPLIVSIFGLTGTGKTALVRKIAKYLNIEKDLVLKSTEYLAKTLDVVLYGSSEASESSIADVDLSDESGNASVIEGVGVSGVTSNSSVNSNKTLIITLSVIGVVLLTIILVLVFSKKARYKIGRFFSEMFAGLFGKKKRQN